jgi:hypothetical protein
MQRMRILLGREGNPHIHRSGRDAACASWFLDDDDHEAYDSPLASSSLFSLACSIVVTCSRVRSAR